MDCRWVSFSTLFNEVSLLVVACIVDAISTRGGGALVLNKMLRIGLNYNFLITY